MPLFDAAFWSDRLRRVFERYDDALLRRVAGRLYRPRNQWPKGDLIERSAATVSNAAVIDRRLADLRPEERKLLAFVGHSRQPRWKVGSLLELLTAVGHAEGTRPVLALFEAGLLYPEFGDHVAPLRSFEQWLGQASATGFAVFAHPHVTARAVGENLGLPDCPGLVREAAAAHEADGLEWLLRLAIVWQQVLVAPLRQTQQGEFFKRDLDRLHSDALLNAPFPESPVAMPDAGLLAIALAKSEGVLQDSGGELHAAALPAWWVGGLLPALESLWAALPLIESWNAQNGAQDSRSSANPYPAAYLLCLLLLGQLPESVWARPAAVSQCVQDHHPYWKREAGNGARGATHHAPRGMHFLMPFLLGLAQQLRLVQTGKDPHGQAVVRLSQLGRWLIGVGGAPPPAPPFPKTILIQPNLEIVAYRQGLTPSLIASLSQFAAWKGLGAACILQLQPDTVYRALEMGWTFESIVRMLEQCGMRSAPAAVMDSLRTWADKRERLSVYASAALFEFATAHDLDEALARGLPGIRLADRLAVVPNENQIDYRQFRLTGTRDYSLPPDRCVEVDADGVTLTIDGARADLLLETELRRFAELLERPGPHGRRQYRLTPASVGAGRNGGLSSRLLEDWFVQRTGQPISSAARLLLAGPQSPPMELHCQLVIQVNSTETADGLLQWPATKALIRQRLGPTALAVAEENVEALRERLRELGMSMAILHGGKNPSSPS
jgi:hypothetical protein